MTDDSGESTAGDDRSAQAIRKPAENRQPGKRDRVAEVRQGSSLNLVAAGVSAVTTTAVTLLVAREFSKPLAGAFFTATSAFFIVASLAGLGTNVGLTYFIARLRSLGEERRIPGIQRSALIPMIVASLIITALMLLLAAPLANLVLKGHAEHAGVTPGAVADALRALAIVVPFAALLNAYLGSSRGYGDMRPSALVGQIGLSVGKLLGVLVAVAAGSAALIAPLWALPYVPMALIAWFWGRRISRKRSSRRVSLPDVPPELAALLALATPVTSAVSRPSAAGSTRPGSRVAQRKIASATSRGFWSFTTPRAIANTAQNILQQIDIVFVAVMLGPAQAAVYTAATRFLVFGQLGSMAINRASQTRITELFTLGDRRGANSLYRITTAWLVLLLWPIYLLALVYGPVALTLFGHSYRAGEAVIVILAVAALIGTACGQVDMVLITSGRSSWSLVNGLLTVGVNIGLDLVLIPRYGITGAAIGWAVAIVVSNLMPLIQLAVVFRVHPFGRGPLIACVLAVLSFGVVAFLLRTVLGQTPAGLAASVIAGCMVLAAGLWRFRGRLQLPAWRGLRRMKSAARSFGSR